MVLNPLVSIIMPAYNSSLYIAESIESVINQTYKNWELLIIDDGSTDNTCNIIKEYVSSDNRIHYFYQKNAKQAKARNLGLKNSKGDLIAFLDSDDLWLNNKLEICLKIFLENSQDILFTNAYQLRGNTKPLDINQLPDMEIEAGIYKGDNGLSRFLYQNKVPMLTAIVRKEAILNINGFRDSNRGGTEDYELWLNLLANGYTIRGIDQNLAFYRIHEQSTSSTNNMKINVVEMFRYFFTEHYELVNKYKTQVIFWLSNVLEETSDIKEIYSIFNRKTIKAFSLNTGSVSFLYFGHYFLSLNYQKRILRRFLRIESSKIQ